MFWTYWRTFVTRIRDKIVCSTARVFTILGADVVQIDNLLYQLHEVLYIVGRAQVVESINKKLLSTQEVLGHLLTGLLMMLIGSDFGDLLALLTTLLDRSLALATVGFARCLIGAIVLVHTLHVIEKVVATREAVTWDRTLAVTEVTKIMLRATAVHVVDLTLMAEKASLRGELNASASLLVATDWLQVRIHVSA
jgi:uncharacterized membrane protein YeaQ/YmgE (transglycosylase-associated protein family)